MADKPEMKRLDPRKVINERGEKLKKPMYAAPENPTKSNSESR